MLKKIRNITKYCKITQKITLKQCMFLITFSTLFASFSITFTRFSALFVLFSNFWTLTHLTPYTTKTYIKFYLPKAVLPQNTLQKRSLPAVSLAGKKCKTNPTYDAIRHTQYAIREKNKPNLNQQATRDERQATNKASTKHAIPQQICPNFLQLFSIFPQKHPKKRPLFSTFRYFYQLFSTFHTTLACFVLPNLPKQPIFYY